MCSNIDTSLQSIMHTIEKIDVIIYNNNNNNNKQTNKRKIKTHWNLLYLLYLNSNTEAWNDNLCKSINVSEAGSSHLCPGRTRD